MMPMRRKGASPANAKAAFVPLKESPVAPVDEWEVRPGGMLVQKREPDSASAPAPATTIRVRVKYGAVYHEIHLSSQATFGNPKIRNLLYSCPLLIKSIDLEQGN